MHKAGLEEVDKDKLHKVITEASKGSRYLDQEKERLNAVAEKVEKYLKKIEQAKKEGHTWEKLNLMVHKRL